jgi:signal transduction histidine kinase
MRLSDGVLFVFLTLAFLSNAREMVIYRGQPHIKITHDQISYFPSGDTILTLDKARSLFRSGKFLPNRLPDLNLGIASDNYWVAIEIQNAARGYHTLHLMLENPRLNAVDVYILRNDTVVNSMVLGDNFPFGNRPTYYNDFSIPLELSPAASLEVFLLIKHKGNTLQMPVHLFSNDAFLKEVESNYLFTGIITGILLICFLFGSFFLINNRDPLFIYYSGYILTAGAWLWTTEGYAFQFIYPNMPELATRLGPGISAVSACFFIANCLQFCKPYDSSSLFRKGIIGLLIFLCLWSVTPFIPFIPLTEKTMSIYLSVYFTANVTIALVVISYLLRLAWQGNNIVLYYFFAVLITIISAVAIVLRGQGIIQLPLSSGTIMSLAYVMELILMTAGIARQFYIYRKEKELTLMAYLDQQKSITEKILQTQEMERVRIGRELHDDIGAGLTQISLMSEMARRHNPVETADQNELEDIARISRMLVNSMGEIVWALNPENKSLSQLMIYVREQLHKLLEYAGLSYTIQLPVIENDQALNNVQLRNVLLITKELVNNAIKYSKARHISVQGEWKDSTLTIEIKDDGIGMDVNAIRKGNGLRNVQRRTDELGGTFQLNSAPGAGVACRVSVPL